jgi:molybdate transport system regulatory protein
MKIRHKVWFENDGKVLFGTGRYKLFKAIEESHSLNAAAKKLNMSYRAAWGRLKASEERMGMKLVERSQGKGMHLTAAAAMLVDQFDQLEQKTLTFLEETGQSFSSSLKNKAKSRSVKKDPDGSEHKG